MVVLEIWVLLIIIDTLKIILFANVVDKPRLNEYSVLT